MGDAVTLTCDVEGGFPLPELAWYQDGEPMTDETDTELLLVAAVEMDGAVFTCSASNDAGEAISEELALIVGGEFKKFQTVWWICGQ